MHLASIAASASSHRDRDRVHRLLRLRIVIAQSIPVFTSTSEGVLSLRQLVLVLIDIHSLFLGYSAALSAGMILRVPHNHYTVIELNKTIE